MWEVQWKEGQRLPQGLKGLKVVFKPLLTQRTQRSAFYSDSRSNWPLTHDSLSQFGRWFKCWFELCFLFFWVNLFVGVSLEAHLKKLPCCAVLLELWIESNLPDQLEDFCFDGSSKSWICVTESCMIVFLSFLPACLDSKPQRYMGQKWGLWHHWFVQFVQSVVWLCPVCWAEP